MTNKNEMTKNEMKNEIRNLTRQWNQEEEHGFVTRAKATMAKIEKLHSELQEVKES